MELDLKRLKKPIRLRQVFKGGDSLPKYGEKPEGWKTSGKRVKRGLYQSSDGSRINADLNGAANILRKVALNLGVDLSRVGRRSLTTVATIKLWVSPTVKLLSAESQSMKELRVSIIENGSVGKFTVNSRNLKIFKIILLIHGLWIE